MSGAMTRSEFGESSDIENYFENYIHRVRVRTVNLRVNHVTYTGSGVFILSHPTFGVLGSQKLGLEDGASDETREREDYMWRDFDIRFNNGSYPDFSNTTAGGWSDGALIFGSASDYDLSLGSSFGSVSVSGDSLIYG